MSHNCHSWSVSHLFVIPCLSRLLFWATALQVTQMKGFTPVYHLSCTLRLPLCMCKWFSTKDTNELFHNCMHYFMKGLSRMCILSWMFRQLERANDFPHTSRVKGFTPVPVCAISCILRLLELTNDFPHTSQVNCFTPVCVMLCILS